MNSDMNHKLKRKWVNALRGGTYKQCFGRSYERDARCALGVLTEVKIESGMSHERLSAADGLSIICMNDVKKMSFKQIADWVEEHL